MSGTIKEREQLLVTTPESLRELVNLDVRTNQEVVAIDREKKTVTVRDLLNDREYTESYDKLLLALGASPVVPPLLGVDKEGVFVLHNIPELDEITGWIKTHQVKRAVVVGGGFIGLEVAENLIEAVSRLNWLRCSIRSWRLLITKWQAVLHEHLHGMASGLHLGDVKSIEDGDSVSLKVNTASGLNIPADMVVLPLACVLIPNWQKRRVWSLSRGHICTNSHMQTSDPDIYAVGDAVQIESRITKKPTFLALAGPASKQGRIAADNIAGRDMTFNGVIGTSVVKVFDLTAATTGLNSRQLKDANIPFETVTTYANNHAEYYPGASPIQFKLLFGPEGQIYGAQAVGLDGVDKRIDVIATAIHGKLTVYDLEELELAYAPPYGASRDPVNILGFAAANVLRGDVEVLQWDQFDEIDEENGSNLMCAYQKN